MNINRILSFAVLLLMSVRVQSQDFVSRVAGYAEQYGAERLYIHYDKSSYAPGESVWFKIYGMEAIFAAEKSKTVYVDWTDEQGKLLQRITSPLVDATAYGQFDIPAAYKGRYLHVKAYTRWMLNFDSAFIYNKDIPIVQSKTVNASKTKINAEINFFPEGGDMVAGVANKIAFKANDQYGRPIEASGLVVNSKGQTIDTIRSIHDGMGYFYLQPVASETYKAKWKTNSGATMETILPAVKDNGVALQVKQVGANKNFLVQGSPAISGSNATFHIMGTMYQQPVFTLSRQFKDGAIQGLVPTADLPSGILTITVFDDKWKPLAERISYINNEEYRFEPEFNVAHWGLNKRARNEIEITVPDSLTANMSVSVTDMAIDTDSSENIISQLLLSGELKGKIYNAAYYFKDKSDSVAANLDLLMLTHGWRRFNWEALAAGEFPELLFPRDTAYMSISGKIFGATSVQLQDAGNIVILYNQGKGQNEIFTIPIKPDGSFNDPGLIFFDTAQVYYQLPQKKGLDGASVQFMQNKLSAPSYNRPATGAPLPRDTTGLARHFQLADDALSEIKMFEGKVLETVTIKGRTKSAIELLDEKYASAMFQGQDGYSFDLRKDPRALSSMNIFNYLQGQVAGLQVTSGSNPQVTWRGGSPSFFLNESPASVDLLSTISVSDVAYIKVLRPPFVGAAGGGAHGAIVIYTKRGDDIESTPGKGLSNNTITGYTSIRQFFSPDYATLTGENEKKDLRTTLYWNPEVITQPGNNKVKLTFYNNDVTQAFRVVIEGITRDGRLAHVETIME